MPKVRSSYSIEIKDFKTLKRYCEEENRNNSNMITVMIRTYDALARGKL